MRRLLFALLLAVGFAACDCDGESKEIPCDRCGVCDWLPENDCTPDCEGTWGGTAMLDACGVCVGGNTGKTACAVDCAGKPGGHATVDECGTCDANPDNDCQQDCAGTWGGRAMVDECGTCDANPANDCQQDCAGQWGGAARLDGCGVCDDDPANDCQQDCEGVWGGPARRDMCGTCDDDPANDCQQDCAGVWGGVMVEDLCGVCDADPSNDNDCEQDCAGVWNGTAELDECGVCAGGNTGVTACVRDCHGQPGGDAVVDACGQCTGGDTGLTACANWCEPFAGSMTFHTHPSSAAYRDFVASPYSPFGYVDELVETDELRFEGELTLPPGEWAVTWRIAGGTEAFPLTLNVTPSHPSDCATASNETWAAGDQPTPGVWATSPEVAVSVTGASACTVKVSLANVDAGDVKKGYAFSWVRATPLCAGGDEGLCPAVVGAAASCVDDRCVYTAGDADGDGLCDAVDRCEAGDDKLDADHDGAPAACDCNDEDATVHPAALELCGGGDNDCNGLDASEEGAFARHVSLASLTLEPAANVVIESDAGSLFGSVAKVPAFFTGTISVSGGPPTYLTPGRYVADFRLMRGMAGVAFDLAVVNASGRDCVTEAQTTWQPTNPNVWEESPKLAFEVTDSRCPIHFSVRNAQAAISKQGAAFDWARLQHGCNAASDCPVYADSTARCENATCEYTYDGAVCEP